MRQPIQPESVDDEQKGKPLVSLARQQAQWLPHLVQTRQQASPTQSSNDAVPKTRQDDSLLASDEWSQPIQMQRTAKPRRTRLTGPQWQFDTEFDIALDDEFEDLQPDPRELANNRNALPSGPWTPFEWKNGTEWISREVPKDNVVSPQPTALIHERLRRWQTMKDTGHVSRMGVEELATLACLFGVSVSVTQVTYRQPPAEEKILARQYDWLCDSHTSQRLYKSKCGMKWLPVVFAARNHGV